MTVTINGTTGIANDGGYTGDGVVFADTTPANTLVTDTSGNVGIGTSSPNIGGANTDNAILTLKGKASTRGGIFEMGNFGTTGNDQTLGWNRYFDGSTENASIEVARASSTSTAYIKFSTNGGSGSTERARIDSSGNFQFNSGYGSVATAYGCRAWVNFNGTGTVAIRASGNVSSITDNGTGTFRINFATSMTDSNYAAVGTAVNSSSYLVGITSASNNQADYIDIRVTTDAGSLNDPNFCSYAFFR